jgi:VCBS repeat-containing protein
LKYTLLENLAPVGSTPTLAAVEQQFEKPWIDHRGTAGGRYYHPSDNMPDYGREMATAVGEGALMLHLNFTDQQKETLLVRYVQLGIDLYGIVAAGGTKNWEPDGGHASGRKWPIMFAGLMLGNSDMANIGQKTFAQLYFGEDGQTFYVSQTDVDLANQVTNYNGSTFYGHFYGPGPKEYQEYTASDLGLPEWGIRHATYPIYDGKDWDNAAYRRCCTANAWAGFVLAAHIMNQKSAWNHDALFDYMDRYLAIEVKGSYNRQQSRFAENMWDAYRPLFGEVWPNTGPEAPVFNPIGNKTVAENTTLTFSVQATGSAVITYSAQNLPSGSTFTGSTFTWKPTSSQVGSYNVTFVASDGANQTTQTITITVTNVNQPPVFTLIGNKTAHSGSQLAFTLTATDPDGDLITYSAANMPAGATLAAGTFSWTPTAAQTGTFTITFTASDGSLSVNQQVSITVTSTNNPPVIGAVVSQSVVAGTLLSFAVPMSDPDGDSLVSAAMNLPSGATFQNDTFKWTPTSSQTGSYTVTFYANDGQLTTTKDVAITVTAAAATPAITVIIDNATKNTASSGNWKTSDAPNPYGGRSVWGYNGATYTWIFKPTVTGTYRVSMWWTALSTRSNRVPVKIPYSGGAATVYANQQLNGGMWNTLGQYTFTAGATYRVVLTAPSGSPPSTCADAVKFEKF